MRQYLQVSSSNITTLHEPEGSLEGSLEGNGRYTVDQFPQLRYLNT